MMRHVFLPLALVLALPVAAHAQQRGFTAQDMAAMPRYSAPALSPDGSQVAYVVRSVDMPANKSSNAVWARSTSAQGTPVRLAPDDWNVNSPAFSADGRTVYLLSAKSGSSQLYAVPASGGTPRQITDLPVDVDGFALSPDGRQVALALAVFPECDGDLACTRSRVDADKEATASGQLFTQLFVRHWDTWNDGRLNRIFVARTDAAAPVRTATLVSGGLVSDIPSRPFGDLSDLAWSPDGRQLAMSVRPGDRTQPWSTNFDIWLVNADGSGQPRNLTADNKAWDAGPVFSGDGRTLFYRAMQRPGFEADRFRLMRMDVATGAVQPIAPDWDRSADGISLSRDGRTLYTTAQDTGRHPLFAVDVGSGKVTRLTGDGSISSVQLADGTLVYAHSSLRSGNALFALSTAGGDARALTPSASELLPEVTWGEYEQFHFEGWNDARVHGYVVKPWNYQPGRTYPVAFLIHGGPQGSFGDGWSYRWNPQTYAGQGYAVVMIDFHGSTGYGQAFTDAITGHWGDRPLEDMQKGWAAALERYDFLDGDNACALGASYGGYMTNWIAGNWFNADGSTPFKCLVTHNGVFDTRSMGLVTEELWFTEWEFGGTVYDNPDAYERFNPARHIGKWKTPTLVVAGQNDFRVPIDQSLSAFTALQRRGIPSQLLYYPDENHWVLKPQNSVQWHQTVNAWLQRHIGP